MSQLKREAEPTGYCAEFGENPKRAGTVSGRFCLSANQALNASSPLEKSEKVGVKSLKPSASDRKSGDLFCEKLPIRGGDEAICSGNSGRGSL